MTFGELYFSTNGRISRSTAWLKWLIPVSVIFFIIGVIQAADRRGGMMLQVIVTLILLWPNIAMAVKRWHDRDKSAWWLLVTIIPFVGWAWGFVELGFLKGTDGPNRFGPDPLK